MPTARAFFVPYDSDRDFGPTNRNGDATHWATIVRERKRGAKAAFCLQIGAYIFDRSSASLLIVGRDADERDVYLIGYQGKSR